MFLSYLLQNFDDSDNVLVVVLPQSDIGVSHISNSFGAK